MAVFASVCKEFDRLGCSYLRDEPLYPYTTMRVGGPADVLVFPGSSGMLAKVLEICRRAEVPVFVMGKGSNLLVADTGLRGVVIHIGKGLDSIALLPDGIIRCGAGASLAKLCSFALKNALSGLEFAWGIPGSAGGAAYMNAGAYGGEMKDVLLRCQDLTQDGRSGQLSGDALGLSYRHSAYASNGCVITAVEIQLTPGDMFVIREKMDEYMNRRKTKQPLEYPSVGSVFKRPPGGFAGTLIEQCGLKGRRIGGAMVSEKHAGFIINVGGATCEDILCLIEEIQQTVFRQCGVTLECEVRRIG